MSSSPEEKEDNPIAPVASIVDEKLAHRTESGEDHSIIEGSEGVTQHDLDTLRHVADCLPYTAWLVVIVEFAERSVSTTLVIPSHLLYIPNTVGPTTVLRTSSTTIFVLPCLAFRLLALLLLPIALMALLALSVKASRSLSPSVSLLSPSCLPLTKILDHKGL